MIPRELRVYVALEPVNMQLSFDRLAGLVRERLEQEPRTGATVVVFHNRRRTHIKVLWHDKSGYCLLYKRLDRGTFRIPLAPKAGASAVQVSRREVMLMLEGIDRDLLRRARRRMKKRAA